MRMKRYGVFFGAGTLLSFMLIHLLFAESLSDRAQDQFEQGPAGLSAVTTSPFTPTPQVNDEIDVRTFLVQGIMFGKHLKMALLSGRVVREGDVIGKYKIDKITSSHIEFSHQDNHYTLTVENYVAPLDSSKSSANADFTVEFRNASLRDALRFLAKGSSNNIILPEDLPGRVTLSFENVELMEAIRSLLRVNGYEYALESGVIRVGKPDAFAGGTDLRTQNYQLKYAVAKDLVDKVKPLLSDRGSVVSDDRTNTLMIKDRDAVMANIGKLVALVDRKDQQVQIEARIVDANKSFSKALGIRWGASGQKSNIGFSGTKPVGSNGDTGNPLNVNLGADNATSGIGLLIGSVFGKNTNLEVQLTAAEEHGDIQILSRPSVTTLNNMSAKIRSGAKIYVKSTSSINLGTSGGASASGGTSGLQEIDTGIELTVTPQISIDDFIRMKIDAVESEADFSRTVDGIPAVIDNTASTTVILHDGETTVIGGLYRVKTTKEKRGVPGFQSIPLVGSMFQSRARTKTDSELMIFITPKLSEAHLAQE